MMGKKEIGKDIVFQFDPRIFYGNCLNSAASLARQNNLVFSGIALELEQASRTKRNFNEFHNQDQQLNRGNI